MYKTDRQWKSHVRHRKLKPSVCDNLEGWRGYNSEGTYAHLWLFHVDVWQEPSQYCKIIILQLKKNLVRYHSTTIKKKRILEWEREKQRDGGVGRLPVSVLIRALVWFMGAPPSWPSHLSKAPFPTSSHLGEVRISAYELGARRVTLSL